jgi:hypothetical protein
MRLYSLSGLRGDDAKQIEYEKFEEKNVGRRGVIEKTGKRIKHGET